jgi:hypothetical protein
MTSNLISKKIDNYFNELINKQVAFIPKKPNSFNIFYKNYIEHNLLLIFIIILICIFLLFKYYSKGNDNDIYNGVYNDTGDIKNKINTKDNNLKKIKKIKKINKKRELLAKEKNEILSIIDELSELNFEKSIIKSDNINKYNIDNNNCTDNNYTDDSSNNIYIDDNMNNTFKVDAYKNNNQKSEDYYNITEKNSELINGIYFEPPYN